MGGSDSVEFMSPTAAGEDLVVHCACGYAANVEKATSHLPAVADGDGPPAPEAFETPDVRTIEDLVTGFGVTVSSARQTAANQSVLTAQVDASRESLSGINIDEEMVNLLAAQRGYEGASRVLTTMDSMLDTLINRTGLVR
jgi:prolyl-tRNA synthetase